MHNSEAIHSGALLRNWDGDSFANMDSSSGSLDEACHMPAAVVNTYKQYKDARTRFSQVATIPTVHSGLGALYKISGEDRRDVVWGTFPTTESHLSGLNELSIYPGVNSALLDQGFLDNVGAWSGHDWAPSIANTIQIIENTTYPCFEKLFSVLPSEALIGRFGEAINYSWSNKLQSRLSYLYEASREEFPEQAPIAPESIRGLVKLLSIFNDIAYPSIVLTPDGYVRARWRESNSKQLSITFINHNDFRFVVFSPNPNHRGKVLRNSGIATYDMLYEILSPYKIDDLYREQHCSVRVVAL